MPIKFNLGNYKSFLSHWCFCLFQKFYLPTARQVKRIESVLRSPIYNHFSETISGVTVIRAYKCAKRFMDEMDKRADTNIKFFFAANTASRQVLISSATSNAVVAG